jgi:hypothetical protein
MMALALYRAPLRWPGGGQEGRPHLELLPMMVLTQEGGVLCWKYILGFTPSAILHAHLFAAPHTPAHVDVYADYAAIECAASGYAPIPLVNPSVDWTLAPTAYGAQAAYITISWTFTSATTIYGYWLSDSSDTYSVLGELFASPFPYGGGGGTFTLQIPPSLISCPFPEPLCPD